MGAERETQRESVKQLRARGYVAYVLSGPVGVLKQLAGLPDVFVFAPDTLLMLEFKAPDGKLRGSQAEFYDRVRPFLGPHLRYGAPRSVAEVLILAAQLPPAW